jgi:predicted metalloprotease with PDZ domain
VNLFATNPRKEYLAIFCPPATDGKDISGWAESSQSQGIAVWNWEGWDRQSGIGWKRPLLHRVIHIWNAFPPYAMQPKTSTPDWTNWFLEGSTDYYDYDKALIQFQVLSGHSVLAGFFQTYLTRYLGSKYDVPISEAYRFVNEPEQYFFLMYHKGALISFLLDSLLQRLTGNRVSLDDVMRTLYNKFGDMRGTYTNHDIMTIGSALANYDLSRFFNNYVYQNTKLPFLQQNQNLLVDWQALGQILILNLTLASASVTSLSTVVQTSSIKTPTAIATTSSFSAIPTAATSSESTHTYEGINFQPLLLVSILTVFALIVIGWKVRRKVQ